MKIISVVGARPNFMKIAPFCWAIEDYNKYIQSDSPGSKEKALSHVLVHTGQHYDVRMSEAFFRSLDIPEPDINLEIGSGSHAQQLGYTMIAIENVLAEQKPDWVVVVGDVNATLASSVIAKKLNIKLCHIEAGLRSGDLTMPEEINRLVTDRLSDLLFTPDRISSDNLRNEGVPENQISFVGNIMIDCLEANRRRAEQLKLEDIITKNGLLGNTYAGAVPADDDYAVLTLHRPSNVDSDKVFIPLVDFFLSEVAKDSVLIWPVHPRAMKQLRTFGLLEKVQNHPSIILLAPVGYHEMLRLNMGARIMLTDSGGLQEECCILGTPCLTLRWNTERPVTLRKHGGVTELVGNDIERIREEYSKTKSMNRKPFVPELWDGNTAERIVRKIGEIG